MRWHRLQHHTAGTNLGTATNFNIAEHLGTGADHHAFTDLRMTVTMLLTGPAERDVLQDRDIVLDHRGLADDDTRCVVKHDATSDTRRRVNIDTEDH